MSPVVKIGKWHPHHQRRWVWFPYPVSLAAFRKMREEARR